MFESLANYHNDTWSADTCLNHHLHPLRASLIESAVPLTLSETELCPINGQMLAGSPFEVTRDQVPSFGAVRAPLGTILHLYKDMSLMLQANGLWLTLDHRTNRTYVGYNRNMDTSSKPTPSPALNAWLDEGKVICFHGHGHKVEAHLIALAEAKKNLGEIIESGDEHFLEAHRPNCSSGPHVIPAPKQRVRIDFSQALKHSQLRD